MSPLPQWAGGAQGEACSRNVGYVVWMSDREYSMRNILPNPFVSYNRNIEQRHTVTAAATHCGVLPEQYLSHTTTTLQQSLHYTSVLLARTRVRIWRGQTLGLLVLHLQNRDSSPRPSTFNNHQCSTATSQLPSYSYGTYYKLYFDNLPCCAQFKTVKQSKHHERPRQRLHIYVMTLFTSQ